MINDIYTHHYYLEREELEAKSYQRGILRPGDMGAALCYAYGYISFSDACLALCIPEDEPRCLTPGMAFKEQVKRIKSGGKRIPELVVDVGAGRGELAAAFALDGVRCIGIDPAPASESIFYATLTEWANQDKAEFMRMGAYGGLSLLKDRGDIPDTIILCETLEHLRCWEFFRAFDLMVEMLSETQGLLIIVNWLDRHPIAATPKGEHVMLVDDILYDELEKHAECTVFRRGSHLVLGF